MIYFTSIAIDIFCLSIISVFLNIYYNIRLNHAFLISICLCGLLLYTAYIIFSIQYLKYFIYSYFLITILISFKIFLDNKIKKENINLLLEFLIICLIISIFSWNRYYLDEDELNHWGKIVKYFHNVSNPDFENLFVYLYHKPFLPLVHFFNSFFSGFKEDISIFSNNLFIVSGFYFVFYNKQIYFLKRIFLFIIFYLCLNSLSFGLVSIYADPIISILYLCIVILIYSYRDNYKYQFFFIIFILCTSLFLAHRSGIVYIFFATIFWIAFHGYKNIKYLILLILTSLVLIYYILTHSLINYNFFDLYSFKFFLKNFLFVDIYFSDFGLSFNTILSFFKISNFKFPQLNINVLFWLILILLILFFNYKKNFKIVIFILLQFFLYSIAIYIFKIKIGELSILVYGRYIGIFFLSALLFCIFITSLEKNKLNTYILLSVFFVLLSITPNKTYGFLLPNNLFLQQEQNLNFWEQKQAIKKIYSKLKLDHEVFVVTGSAKSKKTLYHPSMPFSLMNFEFFPIFSNSWMIRTVSFYDYVNKLKNFLHPNIIFYNFTPEEKEVIQKLSGRDDLIYLNFQ